MPEKLFLLPGVAEALQGHCADFSMSLDRALVESGIAGQVNAVGGFRSAEEIGGVYADASGTTLPNLLSDFAVQADAMGVLFGMAGGLISEQDESAAAALNAAAAPPPELSGPAAGFAAMNSIAALDNAPTWGFQRVAGEDASGMSLEALSAAASALDPASADSVAEQFRTASTTLETAAATLRDGIDRELGTTWAGEFADAAIANVAAFHQSAVSAAGDLQVVADKATGLSEGYDYTRTQLAAKQSSVAGAGTGDGAADAARAAALEDAVRIVHTEYNPRIEDANLTDMTFTTAHRIGSGAPATGGQVSPTQLWNPDPGVFTPSGGATTSSGGTAGGTGVSAGSAGPSTSVDAATRAAAVTEPGTSPAVAGTGGTGTATGAGPHGTGTAAAGQVAGPLAAGAGAVPAGATPGGRNQSMTTATANGTPTGRGGASGLTGSAPRGSGSSAYGGTGAGARGIGGGAGSSGALAGGRGAIGGGPSVIGGLGSGAVGGAAGMPGSGMGASGAAGLSGAAGATGSGAAGPGTAGARGAMMGAMPMGAGAGRGDEKRHETPDYLIHPEHTAEVLADGPQQVEGVLRGRR